MPNESKPTLSSRIIHAHGDEPVLEGVMNFRDAGGLATKDGRQVKRGVLWRSAGLGSATPRDMEMIKAIGLVSIVDLRGAEERLAQPTHSSITDGVSLLTSDADGLPGRSEFMQSFSSSRDLEVLRQTVEQLYRTIAARHAGNLRLIFESLAAGAVPMLIHCAAGKDRTGVAIALVLEAVGVDRASIYLDYTLTNDRLDWNRLAITAAAGAGADSNTLMAMSAEASDVLKRADRRYLEAALADLDERHGTIHQFLQQEIGINGETMVLARKHLLET